MVPTRVYVDTSVFGGVFDDAFSEASKTFFGLAQLGKFQLVVSGVVRDEISYAPGHVQALFREAIAESELLTVTPEALELCEAYLSADVVSRKWNEDALHVAMASVSRCVMILSWNFKHIVNYRRIPQYNAVNAREGYGNLAIYSPLEVISDEKEEEF